MSYRHSIYIETPAWERLARLAAGVASQKLKLPYIPAVHYFREDPAGRFKRPVRVAGFVDHHCHLSDLCVFVRNDLGVPGTVDCIFHESYHVYEAHLHEFDDLLLVVSEQAADAFSRYGAPSAETYETMIHQLERRFKPPSKSELMQMQHARRAREANAEIKQVRRERAEKEAEFRRLHWRELRGQREGQQRRKVEKLSEQVREMRDRCRFL